MRVLWRRFVQWLAVPAVEEGACPQCGQKIRGTPSGYTAHSLWEYVYPCWRCGVDWRAMR
jgi:DNA-directed RNA polymerase subunit RPC12/RpoP